MVPTQVLDLESRDETLNVFSWHSRKIKHREITSGGGALQGEMLTRAETELLDSPNSTAFALAR